MERDDFPLLFGRLAHGDRVGVVGGDGTPYIRWGDPTNNRLPVAWNLRRACLDVIAEDTPVRRVELRIEVVEKE